MNPATLHRQVGYLLLVTVLGLVALGIVMLFSISGKQAAEGTGAIYGAMQKQVAWIGLGGIACAILCRCDYHEFVRRAPLILLATGFLLLLVFVPHIGKKINGSWRWINVAGFTLQPSEFVKWALILFLSFWLGKNQRRMRTSWQGMGVPCAAACVVAVVLLVSQDIGSTAMVFAILSSMLFVGGAPKRWLIPIPFLALAGLLSVAWLWPERRARLLAFLHPEAHSDKAHQQLQALIAFGSGGPDGIGLGNSRQKMYWLPEANTDFIFPVVGEELGLWVTLGVVLCFLLLMLCSGWITFHAPDPQGVFLGTGITTLMGLQAIANMGVVTSLLPNKGLPLPFISYGGSNLMLCMICVGMLLNLQRQGVYETKADEGSVLHRRPLRAGTTFRM
jgi:cell division protein FtsW